MRFDLSNADSGNLVKAYRVMTLDSIRTFVARIKNVVNLCETRDLRV